MARRKQQHPQANVGPVEVRQEQADHAEPTEEPELDIEEWEEQHAVQCRPRKRAKKQIEPRTIELHNTLQTWEFASVEAYVEDQRESDALGATLPTRAEVSLQDCAVTLSSPKDAPGWHSQLNAPSIELAEALHSLIFNQYIALGPLNTSSSVENDEGLPRSAGGASSQKESRSWAALSLTDKILETCTQDAEDQRYRVCHTNLLKLLRWLRPDAKLDPDEATDVPLSPPGSPTYGKRDLLNAGDGTVLPESPTAKHAGKQTTAFDASELYRNVKPTGQEPELTMDLPQLKPTLRRYQKRAAQWMVDRERGFQGAGGSRAALHPLWREVKCNRGGRHGKNVKKPVSFYINPFIGLLSMERFEAAPSPKGGISADEMGLGKTIELLALISANPYKGPPPSFDSAHNPPKDAQKERIDCVCGAYDSDIEADSDHDGLWLQCEACHAWQHGMCVGHPHRAPAGQYICGPCLRQRADVCVSQPCGTTLVICPTPILRQWYDEIHRHIQPGALKVIIYEGQPQPGRTSRCPRIVTAADLAAADIVLTTYDVLRKDLHHDPRTAEETQRAFRRQKKYEIIPTPLSRLRFWRVAIDEAQMVESSTAKAASMALLLDTEHRWCVTGTPLSRGLEDLQGLMAFLQVEPYANKTWWTRCIQKPYESGSRAARARLLALLRPSAGGLLWRSAKADVAHELGLPPQHHHLSTLQFSAIERHFYSRQHQECVGAARAALSASTLAAAQASVVDLTGSQPNGPANEAVPSHQTFEDRPLTQREEHKVIHPLLRLRQACVHPQVGAGGIRALSAAKTPMTMNEVLDVLLAKAKVEAEDAQRVLLASLNGLAGLLLLQGHIAEAVRAYREVIKIVDSNAALVGADKLQQLHTIHNLAATLEGPAKGLPDVPHTLQDSSLREKAAVLREEYLAEPVARLAVAEAELKDAQEAPHKIIETLRTTAGAQAEQLLLKWWIDAIHLFSKHTPDEGAGIVNQIKDQLSEADLYRQLNSRNASSIAQRFRNLYGLQMVLKQELKELGDARQEAVQQLSQLQREVATPSKSLVELAATCARCRPGETSVPGRVCKHCILDEKFMGWELRLFSLRSFAREAGTQVSAAEALRAAQSTTLSRIGQGGLGEVVGPGASAELGARRTEAVANSNVYRSPSQAEQVLRQLAHQLRVLRVPPGLAAQRDLLATAAKAQLDTLEAWRREFLQARAAALEQRQKLYAMDELEMCATRMTLRAEGEFVTRAEELFKIQEAEIPVRSTELSADKAVAAADLKRTLGTLRYLQGLKVEQERKAAGASPQKVGHGTSSAHAGGPSGSNGQEEREIEGEGEGETCPVCHDILGQELVMLPCGHKLCCRCHLSMTEQIPTFQPAASKRIGCPTCRARVPLSEVAYIVGAQPSTHSEEDVAAGIAIGAGATGDTAGENPFVWSNEGGIRVQGSYGTKLEAVCRRVSSITNSDPESRVLVFSSWKDSLELVSHALTTNSVPHIYPRTAKHFEAAIARFRGDENDNGTTDADEEYPRVLLLLVKQGGNGLNLQQAQHVVLVEPLLDPAQEAQAVGRVDRIGQTHATHVHRFVVTHSVEENVHRLGQHRAAAMDLSAAAVRRGKVGGERGSLTVKDVAALLASDGQHHRAVE